MKPSDVAYLPELPAHDPEIEEINAEAFGPGRFTRAAYRIREGGPHDRALSFVAQYDGKVIASVRMRPCAEPRSGTPKSDSSVGAKSLKDARSPDALRIPGPKRTKGTRAQSGSPPPCVPFIVIPWSAITNSVASGSASCSWWMKSSIRRARRRYIG